MDYYNNNKTINGENMKNLKKIGLSALAGSLATLTSVNAGEMSVNGTAAMTYVNLSGADDTATMGNPFGMEHVVTFSGSGELDNGMTVSLMFTPHLGEIEGSATGNSTSNITLDMGSMGVLEYQQGTGNIGIARIDDVVPRAWEEASDGGFNGAEVDLGGNGFNYSIKPNDMVQLDLAYTRQNVDTLNNEGSTSGTAANGLTTSGDSGQSAHVTVTPVDGLTVYAGIGEDGKVDQQTFAAVYSYGPVSVGAQRSDRDVAAEQRTATVDDTEETYYSIAFAINENLSASVGRIDTDYDATGLTLDQEATGYGVTYSMGGMAISAQRNDVDDAGGTESENERNEVHVSFAF
jgi:outer membrane protein OmpU